jgi:hypothetical protein
MGPGNGIGFLSKTQAFPNEFNLFEKNGVGLFNGKEGVSGPIPDNGSKKYS